MFNLAAELRRHKAHDELEEENIRKVLKFLECENCYDRSNLTGHVTAGGLVCDKEGNVLMNHHKGLNMWMQFSGHSDGSGDSLSVARREIMEEAGLENIRLISDGILDVDVQQIPANEKKREPAHIHYDINFLFMDEGESEKISDESLEIKWMTIDEAKAAIRPNDTGLFRMLEKVEDYFAKIRGEE